MRAAANFAAKLVAGSACESAFGFCASVVGFVVSVDFGASADFDASLDEFCESSGALVESVVALDGAVPGVAGGVAAGVAGPDDVAGVTVVLGGVLGGAVEGVFGGVSVDGVPYLACGSRGGRFHVDVQKIGLLLPLLFLELQSLPLVAVHLGLSIA